MLTEKKRTQTNIKRDSVHMLYNFIETIQIPYYHSGCQHYHINLSQAGETKFPGIQAVHFGYDTFN